MHDTTFFPFTVGDRVYDLRVCVAVAGTPFVDYCALVNWPATEGALLQQQQGEILALTCERDTAIENAALWLEQRQDLLSQRDGAAERAVSLLDELMAVRGSLEAAAQREAALATRLATLEQAQAMAVPDALTITRREGDEYRCSCGKLLTSNGFARRHLRQRHSLNEAQIDALLTSATGTALDGVVPQEPDDPNALTARRNGRAPTPEMTT